MSANRRNYGVVYETGVEEVGDVRFHTESRHKAVSHTRIEKICNITFIYDRIAEIRSS